MNKKMFYLPIGDWSDDGHGECKKVTVEANGTIQDLREAHFKIEKELGIDIHKIANNYEESSIKDVHLEQLIKIGLDPQDYTDYNVDKDNLEEEYETSPDYIAQLWVDLLNKVDNSLEIAIVENKIESISFYGFDEKGRHIDFVGYGTLGD